MIDETKIMQYADGTLPIEEHEEVKKAIKAAGGKVETKTTKPKSEKKVEKKK